ncbi:unnamed protein product [Amoebophrya sp. A120]|nr:unnamed protein product [Amoebophrya sp. A120]|eukprot:GSA120T00006668001.1
MDEQRSAQDALAARNNERAQIIFFGWGKAATKCLEVLFREYPGQFDLTIVSHTAQDDENQLDTKLAELCGEQPGASSSGTTNIASTDGENKVAFLTTATDLVEQERTQTTNSTATGSGSSAAPSTSTVTTGAPDADKVASSGQRIETLYFHGGQHVCHLFPDSIAPEKSEALLLQNRNANFDLMMSVSYRKRINCLHLAPYRVNFHPSLLPKHRGCFTGFWAIFDGDTETGVTCHHMEEKFDRGKILSVEKLLLTHQETSKSLYDALLPVTQACFLNVLRMFFESKTASAAAEKADVSYSLPEGADQVGEPSYHRRKLPHSGVIQPDWAEEKVERFIRAMTFPPHEGAVFIDANQKRYPCDTLSDYREAIAANKSTT